MGGGTGREFKGEDCQGGGDKVRGGKVKGQLSMRPVATLVVRQRMKKTTAVQSGRALLLGRRPPGPRSFGDRVSIRLNGQFYGTMK